MTDKHTRKVQQCLDDIQEEREDLLKHVDILIKLATNCPKKLSTKSLQSEKEAVLTFLRKVSVTFSELNQTVLKCIEGVNDVELKESLEQFNQSLSSELGVNESEETDSSHSGLNQTALRSIEVNESQVNNSSTRELCDYMKGSSPLQHFGVSDFSTEGPKIPNKEVLNDSYIRKPLDNLTLKAICTSIINNQTVNTQLESPEITKKSPCSSAISVEESDVFSTVSSHTFIHPLTKLEIPTTIPQQYNTSDLDAVKENLLFISRKMGFDTEAIVESAKQFDKSTRNEDKQGQAASSHLSNSSRDQMPDLSSNINLPQFHTELHCNKLESVETEHTIPDKEENQVLKQTNKLATDNLCASSNVSIFDSNAEKLNNSFNKETENYTLKSNSSISSGAIAKQTTEQKLLETTLSSARSCEKVTAWLNQEAPNKELMLSSTDSDRSNSSGFKPVSFIQTLNECPRTDRNELVKERALAEMPDLKFVSVPNSPKVIVNDLSSEQSNIRMDTERKLQKQTNPLEPLEITNDDSLNLNSICVFSHIESPAEFYLQIVTPKRTGYLDLISTTLKQKFNNTSSPFKSKQDAFEQLGRFCYGCIWNINDSWFRMEILDWKLASSEDEVDVQLVDCGLKCTTSFMHLRILTADFVHIPKLATKCHLAWLYPPGSRYLNRLTDWPSSVTDFLYDIANLSRNIMDSTDIPNNITFFKVVFAQPDRRDSFAVDLINYAVECTTLGEMLIDMQLAVEIFDEYEEHPELGGFLTDIDELERPENLNEFVLGYDARDEFRICRFTRPDGSCFKGKHCKLEHVPLKDGYTTDKIPVFTLAINDLIWPCKGEKHKVLVTGYLDACTYLVQLIRDPVFKENLNVDMDREFSDLLDAMNHTKIVNKFECFKVGPALGEIILALHPLAKQWMRVAVRQINPNGIEDTYEVYAVDFGDQFIVPLKNIRVMKEEFMHVPFQVVKVYLGNYQHKKDCDKNKAKKFFQMNICFKTFLAKFESDDPPYRVQLTTLINRDIGPTLVRHGFAEPRRFDCNLTESENKRLKNGLSTALE